MWRDLHKESISSMKMIAGDFLRASSNRFFTSRSLSPWNLDTRSDDDTDRKHDAPHSVHKQHNTVLAIRHLMMNRVDANNAPVATALAR